MTQRFTEVKLFQVKPDKPAEFEALAARMQADQARRPRCTCISYMKRFFVWDGGDIPIGETLPTGGEFPC